MVKQKKNIHINNNKKTLINLKKKKTTPKTNLFNTIFSSTQNFISKIKKIVIELEYQKKSLSLKIIMKK